MSVVERDIDLTPTYDYSARIIEDSVSEAGVRLTTMEVTIPRPVLAEFNTHRSFSRNSASSRAIPVDIIIRRALEHPFVPDQFGLNKSGMQPASYIEPGSEAYDLATQTWLEARDYQVLSAATLILGRQIASTLWSRYNSTGEIDREQLFLLLESYKERLKEGQVPESMLNVHKQYVNRLLENWMWQPIVVTATDWDNFFGLRLDSGAQREISLPARKMKEALKESTPTLLKMGEWHLPFIRAEERARPDVDMETLRKVSASRSAGVSYLTHGKARDFGPELRRFHNLVGGSHMSPVEHVATPLADASSRSGNFRGWEQWRKSFPFEGNYQEFLDSTISAE